MKQRVQEGLVESQNLRVDFKKCQNQLEDSIKLNKNLHLQYSEQMASQVEQHRSKDLRLIKQLEKKIAELEFLQ